MRWFWIIVGVAVVAVAALAYSGFFAAFKSNDWTTFGLSLAALLGTVYGIARNAVPRPHWTLSKPRAVSLSDQPTRLSAGLRATITQEGPGVAERVTIQERQADGTWSEPLRFFQRGSTYDRGDIAVMTFGEVAGTIAAIKPGKYEVLIKWRQEPNTVRQRTKRLGFKYKP